MIGSGSATNGYIPSVILVLALLYAGQSVFIPLAFALFIIALVWPLQAALQRRLPRLLALLIVLIITIFIVVTIASTVAWGFSKIAQWLILNAARLQAIYAEWVLWMNEHGVFIAGPLAEQFNMQWLIAQTQSLAFRLNSLAGTFVLMFVLVMLGLLEVGELAHRLRSPGIQPTGLKALAANVEIGAKLRRYMAVRSFASVLTGLMVWGFALVAGLELAAAWGAIAFALNYIPFLGPLIATVFPTLFAIAQFESWQFAVVIFLCLNVIQFIIGSYLEPLVAGASLKVSPSAVIFSVFFWAFMWGLSGTLIGVPILIVLVVYSSKFENTKWLSVLVSGIEGHDVSR